MKLSVIKDLLPKLEQIRFKLPDGSFVPSHFHITEIGKIEKSFIDCGGTIRKEEMVNIQLWNANDFQHRLKPKKLLDIIHLSQKLLKIDDPEIEVEYQGKTIEKFGLNFDGESFLLTSTQTDCLAREKCEVPAKKPKLRLSELQTSGCAPGTGCC